MSIYTVDYGDPFEINVRVVGYGKDGTRFTITDHPLALNSEASADHFTIKPAPDDETTTNP